MRVRVSPESLKQTKWYEFLIRFLFGGLMTAATGWVALRYGPVIGGLFLAVPSIFPASITLVQTHQKEKEQQKGNSEEKSLDVGEHTAGKTAGGAVYGSTGLLAFGAVMWLLPARMAPELILLLALLAWLGLSILTWWVFAGRERPDPF